MTFSSDPSTFSNWLSIKQDRKIHGKPVIVVSDSDASSDLFGSDDDKSFEAQNGLIASLDMSEDEVVDWSLEQE